MINLVLSLLVFSSQARAQTVETFFFSQCSCDNQDPIPPLSSFEEVPLNFTVGEFSLSDGEFTCDDISDILQMPELPGVSTPPNTVVSGVTLLPSFFELNFAIAWRGDERLEDVRNTLSFGEERVLFDIGGDIIVKESLDNLGDLLIEIKVFNETFNITEEQYRIPENTALTTQDFYALFQRDNAENDETSFISFCVSSLQFDRVLSFNSFGCFDLIERPRTPLITAPKQIELMKTSSVVQRRMMAFSLSHYENPLIVSSSELNPVGFTLTSLIGARDYGQFPRTAMISNGRSLSFFKPSGEVFFGELISESFFFRGRPRFSIDINNFDVQFLNPPPGVELQNIDDAKVNFSVPDGFEGNLEISVEVTGLGNCKAKLPNIVPIRVDLVPDKPTFTQPTFRVPVFPGEPVDFEISYSDLDFLEGFAQRETILFLVDPDRSSGAFGFFSSSNGFDEFDEPTTSFLFFGSESFRYIASDTLSPADDEVVEVIPIFVADNTVNLNATNFDELIDQIGVGEIIFINGATTESPTSSPRSAEQGSRIITVLGAVIGPILFMVLVFFIINKLNNKSYHKQVEKIAVISAEDETNKNINLPKAEEVEVEEMI